MINYILIIIKHYFKLTFGFRLLILIKMCQETSCSLIAMIIERALLFFSFLAWFKVFITSPCFVLGQFQYQCQNINNFYLNLTIFKKCKLLEQAFFDNNFVDNKHNYSTYKHLNHTMMSHMLTQNANLTHTLLFKLSNFRISNNKKYFPIKSLINKTSEST